MIIFIISAEVYAIPQIWKLALFAPTVYALSGFIQARNRFCFLFGFMGLFLGPTLLAVAFSLLGDWVNSTPQDAERKDGA